MLVVHSVTTGTSVHFSSTNLFGPRAYAYLTWFEKCVWTFLTCLPIPMKKEFLNFISTGESSVVLHQFVVFVPAGPRDIRGSYSDYLPHHSCDSLRREGGDSWCCGQATGGPADL